jgi:DNA-binding MarR family transcriptional regulator
MAGAGQVEAVDDLRNDILMAMRRLGDIARLQHHAASRGLEQDATASWFFTLLALRGPLTAGRLADLTGLTSGGVTNVLDRLERAGVVQRRRDPADRRKVSAVVGPEAVARYAAEGNARLSHLDAVLRRRDAGELTVICRFLADTLQIEAGPRIAPTSDPRRATEGI